MNEELYSKFDEALHAELVTAAHADRDRAAAAAVRTVRTHRRQRAAVASAVALVAVPALAFGAFALTGVDDMEPTVSPSPVPSSSQSPVPSPSPTPSPVTPTPEASSEAAPETWDEVPEADRPAYRTGLHADLPRARAMEDWVWQYVDDGWKLEARYSGQSGNLSAQSLFLFAPDGEVLHLFTLRLDYVLYVGHWDPNQRIAWLERHEGGDGFEVVQVDLRDGTLDAGWAAGAVPDRQRTDEGVISVRRIGDTPEGTEVWATVTYFSPPFPAMLRDEQGSFVASAAVGWLDERWAEGWGNRLDDPSVESWVADDFTVAVYEVLDVGWSESEGWMLNDSRWLWHDIQANSVTEVAPQLPEGQACLPPQAPSGEETAPMVGARVVAECDGGTYLIDPKGERAPEPYAD